MTRRPTLRASGFLLASALQIAVIDSAAQRPGGPPRLVLQALDADHDGKLSPVEIQAAPQALLTLDRNGDGQLTGDELMPRPENAGASPDDLVKQLMALDKNADGVLTPNEVPVRMASIFQRGDKDHDGKLTPDEIRSMAAHQGMPAGAPAASANGQMRMDPILNALDADHDGTISAAEIAAAAKSLRTLDSNADGDLAPDEMRVRQQTPQQRVDHMLEEWDTDKDGKIAKSEAPDRMQQQFGAIDKNGDGVIDRDELLIYFNTTDSTQRGPVARPDQRLAEPRSKEQM